MSKIPIFNALRIIPRESEYLDRTSGSDGEIYVDKNFDTLRLFDGRIKGGISLGRADLSNINITAFREKSVESRLATVVYNVTISSPQGGDIGNKYNLNGVYRPIPNFVVGYTYVFVQDDQTNVYFPNAPGTTPNPHPLNFSADNLSGEVGGGTSYLSNVQYYLNGTPVSQAVYTSSAFNTASSRQVRITITNSTPAILYYWCWNHSAMGNSSSVADPGSGSGGISVSVADTVPESPNQGSLWLDTNTGSLYVYYDDGNSEQWIQPAFPFPLLASVAISGEYGDLINKPDLSNYVTVSYVNNALSTLPIEQFNLSIAADDSTQRLISSGNLIKFVGAGGVTTTSDADGTITITGGGSTGNITFVGNTIDSSDSSSISITPAVLMQSDLTVENDLVVNNLLTTVSLSVDNILLQGNLSTQGSGTPEIVSDNEILLNAGTRVEITNSPIKMCSFTTAQRNNLTAQNGDIIYNSSTNKFQGRANNAWVDLH